MISWAIFSVLVAAFIGSVGQFLFKKCAGNGLVEALKDYRFYVAGFLYFIASIILIVALKYESLVLLYPLVSTSYLWTSLLAVKYLNENMNTLKWVGLFLIIGGTVFVV